jgi:hypothetical protein
VRLPSAAIRRAKTLNSVPLRALQTTVAVPSPSTATSGPAAISAAAERSCGRAASPAPAGGGGTFVRLGSETGPGTKRLLWIARRKLCWAGAELSIGQSARSSPFLKFQLNQRKAPISGWWGR